MSMATMQRMPNYLGYLKNKKTLMIQNISSVAIAEDMQLNAMVVKKDLQLASSVEGKPNVGFNIEQLIWDIEKFLGYDNTKDAILIGVGQLGKVLLSYKGFENYGLNIVAAFDNKKEIIDSDFKGNKIFDIKKMPALVKRMSIHLGIITVPKENAQEVCDLMIKSGIKAIWNFAPIHLIVPKNVVLMNEDLAATLAILSNKLKELLKTEEIF
jgi:redox-sensing transcriptional repressor